MSLAEAPARPFEPPATGGERAGLALPLLFGPLRGVWWQPSSGGKVARLLLGTYEREQSRLFQQTIRLGDQVLDIGASVGYYTLLAARLAGAQGRVVAFEPDLRNLRFLRAHVKANRLPGVTVLPLALGEEEGSFRFGGGTGSGTARLCTEGTIEVPVRRLDALAAEHDLRPRHVKIDVEGAELAVLRGGEQLIRAHRPQLFLSTHEGIVPGIHRACCHLLSAWNYKLESIGGGPVSSASELLCRPQ
jgi:FkbM family methyltransferase